MDEGDWKRYADCCLEHRPPPADLLERLIPFPRDASPLSCDGDRPRGPVGRTT